MRTLSMLAVLGVFAIGCAAQQPTCAIDNASEVSRWDGVVEWKLTFVERASGVPERTVSARAYLPQKTDPVPGIVFSHSAIREFEKTYEYLRFIKGAARAGSAVIVMDRTIQWRPYNEKSNRDASVTSCAMTWLQQNAHLDYERLMVAGPAEFSKVCIPKVDCFSADSWLNFGWQSPAEYDNTLAIMSGKGQARLADWVSRQLRIDIKHEWLGVEVSESE